MSEERAGEFLTEIQALYPKFLSDVKDVDVAYRLWFELLEDVEYETAHKALLDYYKHDEAGFPPTYGQLFPSDDVICIRDETIEDWN